MKNIVLSMIAATSVVSAIAIFCPSSASAGPIADRQANQQQRIDKGVQQGTISQREYNKLQSKQEKIAAQRLLYLRDGNLNRKESAQLNNAQNRASRAIYRDRHD
jgi:hypothetical protein